MKLSKLFLILFLFNSGVAQVFCQEKSDTTSQSLLDGLLEEDDRSFAVTETFKATRVVSLHSVETVDQGEFLFLIGHRFGTLNSGLRDLFGLDNATIRFGGDFGITDRLNVGVGRSSFEKTYDGFIKYKLLEQKTGTDSFPFTLTAFTSANVNTLEVPFPDFPNTGNEHRWDYVSQLMLATKVNDHVSLQLAPMYFHRNFVEQEFEENSFIAGNIGTSIKISPSTRLNAEYFVNPESFEDQNNLTNSFNVGFDIETGGHVFQLHLTNSKGMTEKFLSQTSGDWFNGDIFFGFNVARNFNLGKHN